MNHALKILQLVFFTSIILYVGQAIWIPISFALLISFIVYPFCHWLERHRIPRFLSITIVIASFTVLLFLLLALLIQQFYSFVAQLPVLSEKKEVKAKANIEYNQDYASIITFIEQHSIDLVVMGSHGASGFKELFIGSHTQKIVRLSPVPVLVIKRPVENLSIKHIIFAYDFEITAHEKFLKIVDLATLLEAKIHLLFVNTPLNFKESHEINKKLEEYAQLAPQIVSSSNVYNSISFEKGLVAFYKERGGDMVIMLTHVRKGMSRLLNSSVTERVINHVEVPVMSLRILHKD